MIAMDTTIPWQSLRHVRTGWLVREVDANGFRALGTVEDEPDVLDNLFQCRVSWDYLSGSSSALFQADRHAMSIRVLRDSILVGNLDHFWKFSPAGSGSDD